MSEKDTRVVDDSGGSPGNVTHGGGTKIADLTGGKPSKAKKRARKKAKKKCSPPSPLVAEIGYN